MDKLKVGDKVELNGNPLDEQIPEDLRRYENAVGRTHTVTGIQDVPYEGTSGQWITTDFFGEQWFDRAWFDLITPKPEQEEG